MRTRLNSYRLEVGAVVSTDREALYKRYDSWGEAVDAYQRAKARGDVRLLTRSPMDDDRLGPLDQAIQ